LHDSKELQPPNPPSGTVFLHRNYTILLAPVTHTSVTFSPAAETT